MTINKKKLRTETINQFRESIPSDQYGVAYAAFRKLDQATLAKTVRTGLEMAFTAALFLAPTDSFDDNELLFSIAALAHDTSLDALIKELAG